jgi:hypothetical protein
MNLWQTEKAVFVKKSVLSAAEESLRTKQLQLQTKFKQGKLFGASIYKISRDSPSFCHAVIKILLTRLGHRQGVTFTTIQTYIYKD